jgi:hypothetical protein
MQPVGLDARVAPIEMTTGVGAASVPTHFANITIDLQGVITFPVNVGFTTGLEQMALGCLDE